MRLSRPGQGNIIGSGKRKTKVHPTFRPSCVQALCLTSLLYSVSCGYLSVVLSWATLSPVVALGEHAAHLGVSARAMDAKSPEVPERPRNCAHPM